MRPRRQAFCHAMAAIPSCMRLPRPWPAGMAMLSLCRQAYARPLSHRRLRAEPAMFKSVPRMRLPKMSKLLKALNLLSKISDRGLSKDTDTAFAEA